jgi:hypothetical protein
MIPIPDDFDLGRDTTRIKNRDDADRQLRTTRVLLDRFYAQDARQSTSVQLVADEVGMGKTFVALATAYSVLSAMRAGVAHPDLIGCAPRIVVIAPQSSALVKKWVREVGEFLRRCMEEVDAIEHAAWFACYEAQRLDDLAYALGRIDGPAIIVTHMGVLGGGKKFLYYDLKRRFLLGCLFRFWGNKLQNDVRERLLKGAPEGWPSKPEGMTDLTDEERQRLPFHDEVVVRAALRKLEASGGEGASLLEKLLAECKEIGALYVRDRDQRFDAVAKMLVKLYSRVCFASLARAIPLVIVDEAHNWKNGPEHKSNGYGLFEEHIAPHARRALLLTATPFQLRPAEVLELLRVGEILAPSPHPDEVVLRSQATAEHREKVLTPVLETAASQSRVFAKAWSRLAPGMMGPLETAWMSDSLRQTREALGEHASLPGPADRKVVDRIVEAAVIAFDPDLREILREGLRLDTYNEDLSQELGTVVVRHRRKTDHRLVRVGGEYAYDAATVSRRPDAHVLHAAPGLDVQGDAELPHYLLMRCVSEMKKGRGRSALGSALTGCYSTLFQSAEGRGVRTRLGSGSVGGVYLELLAGMVTEKNDPEHPKVKAVVDAVMNAWRAGEKTLIFCFRTHTARRLQIILNERIQAELYARRDAVMGGGERSLENLRSRFTRREGDLISLGLDRVLWSLRWAAWSDQMTLPVLSADDMRLANEELHDLARLALRYTVDLTNDVVDRVFIHRAVEHLVARRLQRAGGSGGPLFKQILGCLADERWVRLPYGVEIGKISAGADESKETRGLNESGVHATYTLKQPEPSEADVRRLGEELVERRDRAQRGTRGSVFDTYAMGPSFWLGTEPEAVIRGDAGSRTARSLAQMHEHLTGLTRHKAQLDWLQRLKALQSMRRALMRESVLLRILPDKTQLEEGAWGDLLVERLYSPLPGQKESMAGRLAVFVEDLRSADGSIHEEGKSRYAMYEATRTQGADFVILVDGATSPETRERVFAGFNGPLMPETLVVTSVGQEGIDLHRHCRNVIHYDLAWNPAVLEQRTGRIDRIGSKTFRERAEAAAEGAESFLDVGVPFLAGTYDERMYEEIRLRAQTFEVLTGGDVTADNLEGRDDEEGAEAGLAFPVLPPKMVEDLRVELHVWPERRANGVERE